jgi:hypothetical protein
MPKYTPSDDGKVVDGNMVVFLDAARDSAPRPASTTSPAQRAELARSQAAALAAAAEKGVPFCAECEQARQELARKGGRPE